MAAAFKFRLEKVLEMRRLKEQRLQARYNELLLLAEAERQRLLQLFAEQQRNREELTARQRGNLEVGEVMNYLDFLEYLAQQIELQTIRVREAEERAEEARQDLLKASQEKKAVEKLREKQHEEYVKTQQRAEIVFLDEISSSRFNRNQADTGGASAPRTAPGGRTGS